MRYEAISPEGRRFEITAPDDASEEQVRSYAISRFAKSKPIAPLADITKIETPSEAIAGHPITRFALGATSPLLGAAQLQINLNPLARIAGAHTAVNDWLSTLEGIKNAGMKARGEEGIDVAGMAGAALNPIGLGVAKALPQTGSMLQRTELGAILGGGMGVTTPVTEGDNFTLAKFLQAAAGTGAGALAVPVVNAIGSAAQKGYNLIEPNLPGGIRRVAGRTALQAAGPRAPQVISELEASREIVPGSIPTAGEAAAPAGSAEFSALQKLAASRQPSEYDVMARAQDLARIKQVRTVGQTPAALVAAEAERKAAADPLYEAARASAAPVNTQPIIAKIDDLLKKNPGNRELVIELQNVRNGLVKTESIPRTNAQEVSSVLDGMKAAISKKDNAFIKGHLIGLKNSLAAAIPGYENAQRVFTEKSAPINQMQIGQELEKKLVPALADFEASPAQKASTYANALREGANTVKRATGEPRYEELSQILSPQQMDAVNSVASDLARKARYDQLARQGGEATRKVLGQEFPRAPMSGYLERTVTVMRAIFNQLEGKGGERTLDYLAEKMRDPREMARIMRAATPSQRKYLMDAITAQAAGSIAAHKAQELTQ